MTIPFYEALQDAIERADYHIMPDGRTTVCLLTLDNGVTVSGVSVCEDIARFDRAIGEQFAREDAERHVAPLIAFRRADARMRGEA